MVDRAKEIWGLAEPLVLKGETPRNALKEACKERGIAWTTVKYWKDSGVFREIGADV